MIVKIYHGPMIDDRARDPAEREQRPADMDELIECDELKIIRGKHFVRLLFYQNGRFKDNREFTVKLRAYVMEQGKTVDRIEFTNKSAVPK